MVMTQTGRPWSDDEVERLLSMAQKNPSAEIGRGVASVRTKAHELAIYLRVDRRRRRTLDPGTSGLGQCQIGMWHIRIWSRSPNATATSGRITAFLLEPFSICVR
jgi:hypothetical protein